MFFKKIKKIILICVNYFTMPLMKQKFFINGKIIKNTRVSNLTHIDTLENFEIGENCYIGHFNNIDASNGVCINEGCQITNYVSILSHSSHVAIRLYGKDYKNIKNKKVYFGKSVEIGAYTFIGPHSTIMPGTNIGKGSIISAYSYVKGDFPEFSIIQGNPAKLIGNTKDIDKKFLKEHPELNSYYSEWTNRLK